MPGRIRPKKLLTACVGVLVAAVSVACSDSTARPPVRGGATCESPPCGAVSDGGTTSSGGDGGTTVAADCVLRAKPFADPTPKVGNIQLTGSVGVMSPPSFNPYPVALAALDHKVRVRIPLYGTDYTAESDPNNGWQLGPLPEGETIVMTEDIDAQNDVLPTVQGAIVKQDGDWSLVATKRSDIEAIYGDLAIDAEKAQVVISLHTSPLNGDAPISEISITAPEGEAVFGDRASGTWERGVAVKTGPDGMAIVANVVTVDYPGQNFSLICASKAFTDSFDFPVVKGAVTRAYINIAGELNP